MEIAVDTRGYLDVGDEVMASPVGPGKITDLTDRGFPRVNHIAVVWCVAPNGLLFDPFNKAPDEFKRDPEQARRFALKLAQKPTVQKLMDMARRLRSSPGGEHYDHDYQLLQNALYEAILAGPKPIPEHPQLETNHGGEERRKLPAT
jgi:hypothetical protein